MELVVKSIVCLLAGGVFVRQFRMDYEIRQTCVTSVSYNWWVRASFFAVGSGLKKSGILVNNR